MSAMAQQSPTTLSMRYAVVTGGNKGIGLEICKQLASKGITVVLTARDEKRGLEAAETLKKIDGLSDFVVFHQLDVTDSASISTLANYVKVQFGKLDILVNNAAVSGVSFDSSALKREAELAGARSENMNWSEFSTETYDLAQQCIRTNYYGAKEMAQALIPLLQLSRSPRIVNVSSNCGMLKNIPNKWAKGVFTDIESLTEEKIDEVINRFKEDFTQGCLRSKDWPTNISAYKVAKAALNAYTRLLAKKYPRFLVNSVHPGYVSTDMTCHTGLFTATEGAENVVKVALFPEDGPSGQFFLIRENSCF